MKILSPICIALPHRKISSFGLLKVLDLNLSSSEYHQFTFFSYGEKKIQYYNIASGDDILITQKLTSTDEVGGKIFDLLLAISSLPPDCHISLFLPYLYCSREEIALDMFLNMLHNLGVEELITYDIHKDCDSALKIVNLSILDIIEMQKSSVNPDCYIIVSPDAGGGLRAEKFAKKFGLSYLSLEKSRNKFVTHEPITMTLSHKKAIIIDDIIDSGSTIFSAINCLEKAGIEEIEIIATHYLAKKNLIFPPSVVKITIGDSILFR
jgi:ribose-phosphate pyrophosphokinase